MAEDSFDCAESSVMVTVMKDRRLRQFALDLLESQETERNRIAGELHDGIGQALAAMKLTVESGLEEVPAALQVTLFRLVQEAFDNIARHSKAD